MEQKILSVAQAAKLIGVTRQAVLKKIKAGDIKAQKVGRGFVIRQADLPIERGGKLTDEKKKVLNEAVRKTVKEYGEALKMLGRE